MSAFIDLTGRRFGKLIVLRRGETRIYPSGSKATHWICRCDCGRESTPTTSTLNNGSSKSCGCVAARKAGDRERTHGLSGSTMHRLWKSIKARCNNPKVRSYRNYGGRGIKMWPPWNASFRLFLAEILIEIGPKPSPKHSIDRIDNERGYEPGNLRWATNAEQSRNRRGVHRIEFDGASRTFEEWSAITGIKAGTIRHRVMRGGWGVADALGRETHGGLSFRAG